MISVVADWLVAIAAALFIWRESSRRWATWIIFGYGLKQIRRGIKAWIAFRMTGCVPVDEISLVKFLRAEKFQTLPEILLGTRQ